MAVYFELHGQTFTAINGADTRFEANEAVSLAVPCDTQEEIDRLWDALVEGGEPGPCGWLKDRYGFSWQVYPAVLDTMLADPDPEKVRRVTACFMAIDKRRSGSTSSKRPSTRAREMDVADLSGFPPRRGTRELHRPRRGFCGIAGATADAECLEPV